MHSIPMNLDDHEVEALSMGMGISIHPHHLHHSGKHIVVLHPTTLKKMHASHKKGKTHLFKFKKGEGFWDTLKSVGKQIFKKHIPHVASHVGKHAGKHLGKALAEKAGFDAETGEKWGSQFGEHVGKHAGHHIADSMGEGFRHHKILGLHHKHSMSGGAILRTSPRHVVAPSVPTNVPIQLGSPYAHTNSPQMWPMVPMVNQNGGYNPLRSSKHGGSFMPAGGAIHSHHAQHRYVSL